VTASSLLRDRSAGILLHPTSLPGRFGIGDIGPEAHRWLDHMAAMSQRLWQILPLGPTGYGDSPYQTLSTFAANPLLVSLEGIREEGLLDDDAINGLPAFPDDHVDFGAVIHHKPAVLAQAAAAFPRKASPDLARRFDAFVEASAAWLDDFALFVSLKSHFEGRPWTDWPTDAARRDPSSLAAARRTLADAIAHVRVLQFLFHDQWTRLRAHAARRGIAIVGDLPIFVAHDSADVWCHPDLFELDADGRATVVAGVPPDYFSQTGQRWGNPLYRWNVHAERGFDWWIARLAHCFSLVDILRIDHFRGFAGYWEIPADHPTAEHGHWMAGPGRALFDAATTALGAKPIIAEDLGLITPDVDELRDGLGYPGMRILQFAFSGDAPSAEFRPETYPANCVVYTGTHDNDTTVGWYRSEPGRDSTRSADQIAREQHAVRTALSTSGEEIHWDLIALSLRTPAATAIYPLQDVLGLGSEARMNVPGREWGNWTWRFRWEQLTPSIERRLADLTAASGRA